MGSIIGHTTIQPPQVRPAEPAYVEVYGNDDNLIDPNELSLLINNAIDVQVQGALYEGTSEDTDDLDGQGGTTFQAGLDQTQAATLTITNGGRRSG